MLSGMKHIKSIIGEEQGKLQFWKHHISDLVKKSLGLKYGYADMCNKWQTLPGYFLKAILITMGQNDVWYNHIKKKSCLKIQALIFCLCFLEKMKCCDTFKEGCEQRKSSSL